MKRNTLTTAVLAGLTGVAGMASVANAVNVNPDGLGQVLLYPYYTARGGNDTLISIVNTTDRGKAAKVRFIEGLNSREVLDFNLYLSPFDVWTAAVTNTADGGAKMVTTDTSCTVPYFVGASDDGVGEQQFLDFEYTGDFFDAGPQGIERTSSGYIEVIEMGQMVEAEASFDLDTADASNINQIVEWAATHVDGTPRGCAFLESFWTSDPTSSNNFWLDASPGFGFDGVSGGLFGSGSIINVNEGTMFAYDATAIDGFWGDVDAATSHEEPGSVLPNLASGQNGVSNVFSNGGVETNTWTTDPTSRLTLLAVNATLTQDEVLNEYITDPNVNARSEWVLTFPTKRFHSDKLGKGLLDSIFVDGDPDPIPPFTRSWYYTVDGGAVDRRFFACEDISIAFFGREEETESIETGPPIVSPPPPSGSPDLFQLCREANVVRFSSSGEVPETSEILGEPLREDPFGALSYTNFELPFTEGWAKFDFGTLPPNSQADEDERRSLPTQDATPRQALGLPVIGFGVTTYTNGATAEGVLSNYGGTYNHKGTRRFVNSGD